MVHEDFYLKITLFYKRFLYYYHLSATNKFTYNLISCHKNNKEKIGMFVECKPLNIKRIFKLFKKKIIYYIYYILL